MLTRYPNFRRGLLGLLLLALSTSVAEALAPPTDPMRELQLLIRHPAAKTRILYVTAHPDDEDAGLLAWLRYGHGVEISLMTLTRGEGGQNEIGLELHRPLGVLRSRELEAAGRYTGAKQYFSSAYDFGYSFSVEETYERWDEETILQELVQVIRTEQPRIVLTLPHGGEGGGQHHQASARLALRACRLAADPGYEVGGLAPYAPERLFQVVWDEDTPPQHPCRIDLSAFDPVLGASYAEVGLWSRGQHKCQGMAHPFDPHVARTSTWDFLWSSNPGADPPRPLDQFWEGMDLPDVPWEDVNLIHEMLLVDSTRELTLSLWNALPRTSNTKHMQIVKARVARALELSLGLDLTARADRSLYAPGDSLRLTLSARPINHSFTIQAEIRGTLIPGTFGFTVNEDRLAVEASLPVSAEPTRPAQGLETGWSTLFLYPLLSYQGRRIPLPPRPILAQEVDPAFPGVRWVPPAVVPDPSIRPGNSVLPHLTVNGAPPRTEVEVWVSTLKPERVTLSLRGPGTVTVHPPEHVVTTQGNGLEQRAVFQVEGTITEPVMLHPTGRIDGQGESRSGYTRIEYPHLVPSVFVAGSALWLNPVTVSVDRERSIGFVEGTGDRIRETLETLGLAVTPLNENDLQGDLSSFRTIVTGVRAYKVRDDLKAATGPLRAWMEQGGHLVVMYNKFEFNQGEEHSPYTPYPGAWVSRDRVTDENASVHYLKPGHSILNAPNTLTEADWTGWVQERGLYFLRTSNPAFISLVRLADPFPYNAGPKDGSLVWTGVGRGSWTYVGLGLFRQLPQGVPGAYRLLANLISQN